MMAPGFYPGVQGHCFMGWALAYSARGGAIAAVGHPTPSLRRNAAQRARRWSA